MIRLLVSRGLGPKAPRQKPGMGSLAWFGTPPPAEVAGLRVSGDV